MCKGYSEHLYFKWQAETRKRQEINLRCWSPKQPYPFLFVSFSFSFFNMLEKKNMQKGWALTLFFTGLRMDKAHSPGAEGGSQNISEVGGRCPTLQGLASCLEKTRWTSLLSISQKTKIDTWQSNEVFKKPVPSRNI